MGKPRLFSLLATGTAQILDLAVPDHAAVDLAVRLAKADHRTAGFAGMVNAVLRRVARGARGDPRGGRTAARQHPDWLARRWVSAYGRSGPPRSPARISPSAPIDLTLRNEGEGQAWAERLGATLLPTGSLRMPPDGAAIPTCRASARPHGGCRTPPPRSPRACSGSGRASGARPLRRAGRQDDAAREPGRDRDGAGPLGPPPGAPSRQLARLGLTAEIAVGDATAYQAEPFDAVLLDAPCSATGTIAATPTSPGPRTNPTSSASRSCRPGSSTGRRRWCGRAGGSSTAPAPWSGPRARRRSPPSSPATRDSPACRSGGGGRRPGRPDRRGGATCAPAEPGPRRLLRGPAGPPGLTRIPSRAKRSKRPASPRHPTTR